MLEVGVVEEFFFRVRLQSRLSAVLKSKLGGIVRASLRFGLGRFNTAEELDYATARIIEVVHKLRELSPAYEMAREGL